MEKEPGKRLGSETNDADQIIAYVFFNGVNWNDVYHKKIEPPSTLESRGPMDIDQDRPEFTAPEIEVETEKTKGILKTTLHHLRAC